MVELKSRMFLNEKLVNLYLMLENESVNRSAYLCSISYSYAFRVYHIWIDMKLIMPRKSGKKWKTVYTTTGKRIFDVLTATRIVFQNTGVQFVGKR